MCIGDNVLLNRKYGIMARYSSNGVAYHATSIKQLFNIAVNTYMGKAVIVWTAEKEIYLNIEKDGFFWPTWERATKKEISKILTEKRNKKCYHINTPL